MSKKTSKNLIGILHSSGRGPENGEPGILDFFLRVRTSVGTLHLPCVYEEAKGRHLELGFNWIVFEADVVVRSVQLFAEHLAGKGDFAGNILHAALTEEDDVPFGMDSMVLEAGAVAYFTDKVLMSKINRLDPNYLERQNYGG